MYDRIHWRAIRRLTNELHVSLYILFPPFIPWTSKGSWRSLGESFQPSEDTSACRSSTSRRRWDSRISCSRCIAAFHDFLETSQQNRSQTSFNVPPRLTQSIWGHCGCCTSGLNWLFTLTEHSQSNTLSPASVFLHTSFLSPPISRYISSPAELEESVSVPSSL
jgi:hypothetical protein